MSQSKQYKTLQIPREDFELLKAYCEFHSLLMGKYVGKLIQAGCPPPKLPGGVILRVEGTTNQT